MKGYTLAVIAVLAIGILGFSLTSAHGFGKGFWKGTNDEEREAHKEQHEAIRETIENGDYDAWEALMQEKVARIQEKITEETFAELQEKHATKTAFKEAVKEARETGDWSEVEALKEEYGLERGHHGLGKHKYRAERLE